MITDDDVEKAVDFLRDNATNAAKCRAERIYLEEYRKSLKAIIMTNWTDLPVSAQERQAYQSDVYIKHLRAIQIAVEEDEKQRFLMKAAEAKIEAWRSLNANMRAIKL
tara:strand:+ start:247 stop:570 length:324 start_codon:yes stop_codon:yes gene_type:complete